jgi:glycosyltransferase involved in cell wall biosynthesis
MTAESEHAPRLTVVLKGYPRLSETFVAQELKGLEERGLRFDIWSLRKPYDARQHPIHGEIEAEVFYLPEYLHEETGRVLSAFFACMGKSGFFGAFFAFLGDLLRDLSRNRVRRFGQACVLAAERSAPIDLIYAHFLHTPASVARYAAMIRGCRWGFSAHARDIWTAPNWDKAQKLLDASFGFTCSRAGATALNALAPAHRHVPVIYHGIDLARFPRVSERSRRDGNDPKDPVRLISVGRAVEKKGYADLLNALADLPKILQWRLVHIGGGPEIEMLKERAKALGLAHLIDFRGKKTQPEVLQALAEADIFVLPAKVASDGDRDGLPNVLLEAASQSLAIVSTRLSAIPEFIDHDKTGVLVRPGHPGGLTEAIQRLARDPDGRMALGFAARARLEAKFTAKSGLDEIAARLRGLMSRQPAPKAPPAPAADPAPTAAE